MHPRLSLLCSSLSLASLYLGERVFMGASRWVADGVALLLGIVTVVAIVMRVGAADAERQRANKWILLSYGISFAGLSVYSISGTHELLRVLWPALVALGFAPASAMEIALAKMRYSPLLQLWRIRLAAQSALVLTLSFLTLAGVNYASAQWGRQIDLSYFRTTEAGDATLAKVRTLEQPLHIYLFFPPGNDVLLEVQRYADQLSQASRLVDVQVVDQAFVPELARRLQARGNGYLALEMGSRVELIKFGTEVGEARPALRRLDRLIYEKLARVMRPERIIYATTGHGERSTIPSDNEPRSADFLEFKKLAESLGLRVKPLGLGEGLGSKIPDDAAMVVVPGTRKPFLPEEATALQEYWNRGGRLLVYVDPDTGIVDQSLLTIVGVSVTTSLVAHDYYLVRVRGRGQSPYDVVTTDVRYHPSTRTLTQGNQRSPVMLLGAGNLAELSSADQDRRFMVTLASMQDSFLDINKNGTFDPAIEERGVYNFAAAVERGPAEAKTGSRAIVMGDVDVASSGALSNEANATFVADSLRWLAGDEATAGRVESEEDVLIVYRKEQDAVWFYGVSFMVPALTLGGGLAFVRHSSRRRRKNS